MESKTNAPSFTVSLRGYDRMEVDEYLDSLAEALGQVEQAEERVHGLQAHIDRQNARIADLEERIRAEVPRSGALLGERIAILLTGAEEAATETITGAQTEAAALLEKAHEEVAAAEDRARGAVQRGEDQARRIEAAARAEAAEIIAEAETRASTRTRQIEQWAEQVVSHTRSEEARMLQEQQEKREQGQAELRALTAQRDAVAANIAQLREQLGQALGLVPPSAPAGETQEAEEGAEAAAEVTDTVPAPDASLDTVAALDTVAPSVAADTAEDEDDEMPWPAAFRPFDESAPDEERPQMDSAQDSADDVTDRTGEIEIAPETTAPAPTEAAVIESVEAGDDTDPATAADEHPAAHELPAAERDEFDTKFDAWMTSAEGPRHFRRL